MANVVEIENIEEMRIQEGIDDVELREEIRRLRVGDHVNLTLLISTTSSRTMLVRITKIRGAAFIGEFVDVTPAQLPSELQNMSPLNFTAAHIHSISRGKRAREY